jgi:tRNA1(Val) A37 N6-methylase TrmN6
MAGDEALNLPACTHGHLLGGRVVFDQPAEGYRAPVDGLLLAAFAGRASRAAADLGAGAGMVTLALLARDASPHVLAVERDDVLTAFLIRNAAANGFTARVTVACGDVEAIARGRRGSVDLVVANPPYWSTAQVTPAAHPRTRSARAADGDGALAPFLRAARLLLGRGGRACFVWPAADLEHLLDACGAVGLRPKRARFVHPQPARAAHRVLVELKPGRGGGLHIEPPLFLADDTGGATPEARAITGRAATAPSLD